MEKVVVIGEGGLLKIAVVEFNRVRDDGTVGGGVHNLEASVVV